MSAKPTLAPDISPRELAALLERPHPPTEEQAEVISAELSPAIVVAGAGSGKTETMANRVVWLVATGRVQVHEVLGMTFTRKAAGELSKRIRDQLDDLAERGYSTVDEDSLDQATVTTYNSFANRIYSQYAVLIGRDPDATVLGEAAAWQLAREVAIEATAEQLGEFDKSLDTLTQSILDMARSMADNIVDPAEVISYASKMISTIDPLPIDNDPKTRKRSNQKKWKDSLEYAATLPTVVELAVAYQQRKLARGAIEFSDQVSLALEICRRFPTVIDDLRSQFRVVLLDEYQDTSVVQAELLALIFGGMGVMAVGDPHQSIYGWRGASADNLSQFGGAFCRNGQQVVSYTLSTSWRNPTRVLEAANRLAAPLTEKSRVPVKTLHARPAAPAGEIAAVYEESILDEAAAVAQWFKQRVTADSTAAMLCRSLGIVEPFKQALTAAGVPFHVVGLGGLLDEPVVVDVVCTLRVLHDATADSELVRLLTGARWAIGLRDVLELKNLASWIAARDHGFQKLEQEVADALKNSVVSEDGASLVDALDFLAVAKPDHRALGGFSVEGLERLRAAGSQIARLRRRAGHDLRELVTIVAQELLLDIEAVANESVGSAVASLDAFMAPVVSYVDTEDRATLGGFLSWLREAERRERLSPQSVPAEKGTVQIMTIHASKGLEWEYVAVPRMVTDEFPGTTSNISTWLSFGQLPSEFRGDAALIPQWRWQDATSQVELEDSYATFRAEVIASELDEARRLAYVATTRAETEVLLAGSFWSVQTKPRVPNLFLAELQEAGIIAELPVAPASPDESPLEALNQTTTWPLDALGARRNTVAEAARLVSNASVEAVTPWDKEIQLLVAERDRRRSGTDALELPARIPASRFKDFIDDPQAVARSLRRPLPEKPYRATNLGTLFHAWVEQRSAMSGSVELVDSSLFERDDELSGAPSVFGPANDEAMAALKATFERSKWAQRQPVSVEQEIHLPLGNTTVVCKIDAVYEVEGSNGTRFEIVDWKTGKAPKNAKDLELKQFQLALYRAAYARWSGVAPENIDAVFYFVADDTVIAPERIYSEDELVERWSSVTGSMPR
jgi:DNA helicase-2/ATP-dependent DNA helicase PcrA